MGSDQIAWDGVGERRRGRAVRGKDRQHVAGDEDTLGKDKIVWDGVGERRLRLLHYYDYPRSRATKGETIQRPRTRNGYKRRLAVDQVRKSLPTYTNLRLHARLLRILGRAMRRRPPLLLLRIMVAMLAILLQQETRTTTATSTPQGMRWRGGATTEASCSRKGSPACGWRRRHLGQWQESMGWRGGATTGASCSRKRIASMWLATKTLGAMLILHGMTWRSDDGGELFEERIASMWRRHLGQ